MIVLVHGGKISILVDRDNTTRLTTDSFMDVTFAVQTQEDNRKPFIDLSWNGTSYRRGAKNEPNSEFTMDIVKATAMHIYPEAMKVMRLTTDDAGVQTVNQVFMERRLTNLSTLIAVLGHDSGVVRMSLNNYLIDQSDDVDHDTVVNWLCDNITRITSDTSRRVLYTWDIDVLYGNLACWSDHRDLSKLIRPTRRVISDTINITEVAVADILEIPEPQ